MYDDFSADYDRFVDWPARLAVELPFLERVLREATARRVLDAACGTGMHAVALARRGYEVVGADASAGMIARARASAAAAGVAARFDVAGFGELAQILGERETFDAILCLGNSLPHVRTPQELHQALADFAACLRPGGVLLLQNLNYDRILTHRQRWMEPQAHREGEQEWLFLRFYDFDPDGLLTFNIISLHRAGQGPWEQRVMSTRLWPLRRAELVAALEQVGFSRITIWGNMQGAPFRPEESPNLVIGAWKEEW